MYFKMAYALKIVRSVGRNCECFTQTRLSSYQVKPLVSLTIDNEGIATVEMQRAPVNALSLELIQELRNSVLEVEKNKCKGLVLTSDNPHIFSAGIDIKEFVNTDVKRLALLKNSLFDTVSKLFGTDTITAVAINGYTGAGACVLTLACEYRAMTTGKAVIGLNDTTVGIAPAKWIVDLMTKAMGPKLAEYAITSSYMFPAEKALQVGLVDEVATGKDDAVDKCKDFIKSYDQISPAVRAAAKRAMRQEYLTELERHRNKYVTDFINTISSPTFQDTIKRYFKRTKS